jgi:hypothetical protein
MVVGLTFAALVRVPGSSALRRSQTAVGESLSVDDPRPVAEAVSQLEKRYGWVITYEDPMYVSGKEITDVTSKVRRDLDKYMPNEAPRVLVPRGGSLAINFNVTSDENTFLRPESVAQQIIDANTKADNAGRFRLERSGEIVHVIPVAHRDSTEAWVPEQSVLDAIITIPSGDRTGLQALDALCVAVSRVTQTKVALGTVDINLFIRSRQELGADQERARDFLVRLLENTRANGKLGETKLSWQLLFGPATKDYRLNVHAVRKPV